MEKIIYNDEFFINKYEKTQEEDWCIGNQTNRKGQHCALGFSNPVENDMATQKEYDSLISIFELYHPVVTIIKNIGLNSYDSSGIERRGLYKIPAISNGETAEYTQDTPRKRMLAAMYHIQQIRRTAEIKAGANK